MRPDVKLGIAVSLVVVVVAGGYFLYRDNREAPVSLTEAIPASGTKAARESRKPAGTRTNPAVRGRPPRSNATPETRTARKKPRPSRDVASSDPRNAPKEESVADRAGKADRADKTVAAGQSRSDQARRRFKGSNRRSDKATGPSGSSPRSTTRTIPSERAKPAGATSDRIVRTPKHTTQPSSADRASRAADVHRTPKQTLQVTGRRLVPSEEWPTTAADKRPRRADRGAGSVPAAVESHRVQPGDSFASLARDYYGDEKFTRFLMDNNRHIADPARLQVGALVHLPPAPSRPIASGQRVALRQVNGETAGATSERTYTVRPGDSFYGIAQDVLGNATRWKELFDLNRALVGGDPKKLQVGQVITLPKT